MNVFYTNEAQVAYKKASPHARAAADNCLASYSHYANRHSEPGKGTLKRISATARSMLGLPPGTPVFVKASAR